MEAWFLSLFSLSISVLITLFVFNPFSNKLSHNLPPGPPTIPIIGNLLLFLKTFSELESIVRNLHEKFGPVLTLKIGSKPSIFIANRFLAHQALIKNSSIFADRPPALPTDKIVFGNQNINTAFYGPTWRLLRRNLTSKILCPTRVKSYSYARKCILEILIGRLKSYSKSGVICAVDHLRYAMVCLLALMCFGEKLEEEQIKEIQRVQRNLLLSRPRFQILNFWPSVGKILFRKRWEELFQMIQDQEKVLIPLIRARKKMKQEKIKTESEPEQTKIPSYVDTLFDLELPEEKRKLGESELAALCSEFLVGGTNTTISALQWIFANLVKNPEIQEKLYMEMKQNLSAKYSNQDDVIKEEDLQKLPYLKAVVLEGLRRHPPGHFVLPHAVTEDTVLNGCLVPKNAVVNVMVAQMGWDPEVWEDPMAFKPERFLKSNGEEIEFDITGSTGIKMMPFGVGRRICPGLDLAMLHLVYFVGNLVWNFEWSSLDGEEVDLSEKQEFFTSVMEKPLLAHLSPRN